MSFPGNPNGQNHGVPGYTNNTRNGFGKSMSSSNPDCQRRTNPRKAMKCESCHDYNKGVSQGACTVCHHKNSVFRWCWGTSVWNRPRRADVCNSVGLQLKLYESIDTIWYSTSKCRNVNKVAMVSRWLNLWIIFWKQLDLQCVASDLKHQCPECLARACVT